MNQNHTHYEYRLKEFDEKITELKAALFGFGLFYDVQPVYMRLASSLNFKQIKKRIRKVICDAEKTRSAVENGKAKDDALDAFVWPTGWNPIKDRTAKMLEIYSSIFPDRAQCDLTKEEKRVLRKRLINYLS